MSGLSVAGIASGIDSDSIISQMVAFETRSLNNLQRRIAIEEAERVTFQDLNGRLQDLQTSTNAFATDALFNSLSTTSSDTNILTATATDAAPRGTHAVKVLQRAMAHRLGGTGIEDSTATKLIENFTATDHTNAGLGKTLQSLIDISDSKLTTESDSTFDYATGVNISGIYAGADNLDIVVKINEDFTTGGAGPLKVRVSTDGGSTFNAEVEVVGVADVYAVDTGLGFTATLDLSAAGDELKDDDEFSFRVRGTAALEYSIGNGERQEILMDTETTLFELVNAINDSSDTGIRGDILNDGSSTNPFRLILSSLTEGRSGEINILHNDSSINLTGVSAEDPVIDSTSYTGDVTLDGTYAGGMANSNILIEIVKDGAAGGGGGNARFRISVDGGLTFHDGTDVDAGFEITGSIDLSILEDDDGNLLFASDPGIDITFSDPAQDLNTGDLITVDLFEAEIQEAQDALININGINLVKSSNVIDDIFEGLTLNLIDADPDKTINITIAEKAGDISSAMNSFVTSYNSVMGLLNAQSSFDPEEDTSAPLLMGDATLRQIQTSLQRYVTGRISILGGDTLSALSDIGISTDSKTGQLSFDSAKLATALNDDSTAVRRLLSRFGDLIDGSNASYVSSTSATQAGSYQVEVTTARTRAEVRGLAALQERIGGDGTEELTIRINSDAQDNGNIISMIVSLNEGDTVADQLEKIQSSLEAKDTDTTASLEDGILVIRSNNYGDDFEIEITSDFDDDSGVGKSGFHDDNNAVNLANRNFKQIGTDLVGKFNGLTVKSDGDTLIGGGGFAFEDLRIRVSNDFIGDAGTIRLNDGLGSSFSKLLDRFISTEGVLSNKIGSFDSAISRIEQQITRVNERASLLETRLRKQFVNLEVTLGRLNAQGDFLTQQLKTLPGISNKK
jgi:flagellar hook-associated protein 2